MNINGACQQLKWGEKTPTTVVTDVAYDSEKMIDLRSAKLYESSLALIKWKSVNYDSEADC